MVLDSKINADDTGRLVSGTGIPAIPSWAPSVTRSDLAARQREHNGRVEQLRQAVVGSFQLLNDSGQPVTLSAGFVGNITLGAEGALSTVAPRTARVV